MTDPDPIAEFMEPVYLEDGTKKWLNVKKFLTKEAITKDGSKNAKEIILAEQRGDTLDVIKTKFQLKKESVWQCLKCGALIQSNPKAPILCDKEQGGCDRMTSFKVITKAVREDYWKIPIWKEIKDLDTFELYDSILGLLKDLAVLPEEIHYKILTLWIISTWKRESWETVGFPVFRGIIGSGKTRVLNVIQELTYRCVPCATATFSALGRLSHFYNVSITVDEANSQLNPRTESGVQLLNFIKQSYKKGSKYVLADTDDPEECRSINNFGFKAFAGEKSFNPALVSRGIDIFMEKAEPMGRKLQYYKDEFERIRTLLLNYRYSVSDPEDLGENFILTGRTREVYESIIATGIHIGQITDDIIEFAQLCEKESEEELQGTIEYEILLYIKNCQENIGSEDTPGQERLGGEDAPEIIIFNELADAIGWGESKQKQRLGYVLKNMGLTTKRTRQGRAIPLTDLKNARHINYLYRRYKVKN